MYLFLLLENKDIKLPTNAVSFHNKTIIQGQLTEIYDRKKNVKHMIPFCSEDGSFKAGMVGLVLFLRS
jgi:hypothetical protein